MHANFSNGAMRDTGGKELFDSICEAFGLNIEKHMSVYGAHNEERLTGLHETQSIHQFSYGVSDRGASIRVPASVPTDGWVGRRRPPTCVQRRPLQDWLRDHLDHEVRLLRLTLKLHAYGRRTPMRTARMTTRVKMFATIMAKDSTRTP